nr:hypothetical protein [uncultured Blautia sp.]
MKEKVIADRNTGKMKQLLTVALLASMCMVLFAFVPAFAAADLASLLNQIIGIVKAIFVAVGIILLVYSIGQLALAFKNEDADSKTRASTMLVVAAVLIAFPAFIDKLNLTQYVNGLI